MKGIAYPPGFKDSPEYQAWRGMRSRCLCKSDPAYENYGGRNITICSRWESFENFLADMGPKPTPKHRLDRIENDLDYTPNNCAWVTPAESNRNTRATVWVDYEGQGMCLKDAAVKAGVNYRTALDRYRRHLPLEKVLSKEYL